MKDYVFHSESGCYKSAPSPKELIAALVGTVCKKALITGQGTSLLRYTLPVFPRHTHSTWEYLRTLIKSTAQGDGSTRAPSPESHGPGMYGHDTAFKCPWIRERWSTLYVKGICPDNHFVFVWLFQHPSIPVWPGTPGHKEQHCGGYTAGQSSCTGQWLTSLAMANTTTKATVNPRPHEWINQPPSTRSIRYSAFITTIKTKNVTQ